MQNTQNEFIVYKEIQENTMLKWLFDSKIKHTTEDEFFKTFGNNTQINNAYSINMKPLYSYHGGIDTTSSNITEKETWWFIMIIKDDGTALAYNKTLDLHYTLNKY